MSLTSTLKKIASTLKGEKELTPSESQTMMKNLIGKGGTKLTSKSFTPGTLLTYKYDAKDKDAIYDRTPFVMVLSQNSKYVMGINFHWAPVQKRLLLVKFILAYNNANIKAGRPLKMNYKALRQALKKIGMFPVLRKYIKQRISYKGVIVPDNQMLQAAKMKTETFTGGKVNATTLWQRAVMKAKRVKRKLKIK